MSLHNVSVICISFLFSHPYVFALGIHSVVVCPFLQGHFSFYEKNSVPSSLCTFQDGWMFLFGGVVSTFSKMVLQHLTLL